jgi:hypothetical protein
MERRAFEPTGLVPRSIIRTLNRFIQQLKPETEAIAVQEFRISRYQVLVSVKSLILIFFIPLFVNISSKAFLFEPFAQYIWNKHQHEIFLNSYQENRAFLEMQDFSERIFFESLIKDENIDTSPGDQGTDEKRSLLRSGLFASLYGGRKEEEGGIQNSRSLPPRWDVKTQGVAIEPLGGQQSDFLQENGTRECRETGVSGICCPLRDKQWTH